MSISKKGLVPILFVTYLGETVQNCRLQMIIPKLIFKLLDILQCDCFKIIMRTTNVGLGELVLKCRLQIVNACQRKVAHTKTPFLPFSEGNLPELGCHRVSRMTWLTCPLIFRIICPSKIPLLKYHRQIWLALLATFALSTFHPAHIRRKLAELNIYLTEDEIENYKEARTKTLGSKRKLRDCHGSHLSMKGVP